ncbi:MULTISPECIES: hypothetical protein [Corynebacterium]|uniref:hypothetical protein n=1 Tax=Corynebacterium TaxID=1716 RepID=UPI00124DC44D|nr:MULTISPECIES: hypothetical protein [Corynebacterium]
MSVHYLHLVEAVSAHARIIDRRRGIRFCFPDHPLVFHAHLRAPAVMFISASEALRESYTAEQRHDAVLAANGYHQEGHHAKLGIAQFGQSEALTAMGTASTFLVDSLTTARLERHVLRCCYDIADALHWLSTTLDTPTIVPAPNPEWLPRTLNGPWTEPDTRA